MAQQRAARCSFSELPESPFLASRALPFGPQAVVTVMCGQEHSQKSDCLGWSLGFATY